MFVTPMTHAPARHECMIYEGAPSVHLRAIAAVATERLRAKYRCLYLHSPAMVAGMRAYLAAAGADVSAAIARGEAPTWTIAFRLGKCPDLIYG
jgi:hypothetical protein